MNFAQYRKAFDFPHSPLDRWTKYDRDVIPLWVADMDYPAPEEITKAVIARASSGQFGYVTPPDSLFELVVEHCWKHYHWSVHTESIVFLHGVVPGLLAAVRALTAPQASIVVPTPLYTPFFKVIESEGRLVQEMAFGAESGRMLPLSWTSAQNFALSQMIMWCHPHNPSGTVFRADELQKVADLAMQHDWIICSDDIHAGLVLDPQCSYQPIASLDTQIAERTVTLMSPSKVYNMASIGMAYAIIPNANIRKAFKKGFSAFDHFNPLSLEAMRAALTIQEPWLERTIAKIVHNIGLVQAWVTQHADQVSMVMPEASYLVWLKIRTSQPINLEKHFASYGVGLQDGRIYRGGHDKVRLNVATDAAVLQEALTRMSMALSAL